MQRKPPTLKNSRSSNPFSSYRCGHVLNPSFPHPNDECILASPSNAGRSFAVIEVQMVWCAYQNTLRRPLEPLFFSSSWYIRRHLPSVRGESKLWLMSTQAVLHWEWQQTAFPYLLCYRLFWLHQGTLRFALGQMEKADLAGFLLMCGQMSSSPYHWVIIQISLWQPWKRGADSNSALLTAFCILVIIHIYICTGSFTWIWGRTTLLCRWLVLPK